MKSPEYASIDGFVSETGKEILKEELYRENTPFFVCLKKNETNFFSTYIVAKMSIRDITEYTTNTSHLLQIIKLQAERWEYSAALATIQDTIK